MKPSATRAATARVLAEIDDAVRPVERARTAAAVDRVLASAAPSIWGDGSDCGLWAASTLCRELDVEHAACSHPDNYDCCEEATIPRGDAAANMLRVDMSCHFYGMAPWEISPHLFPSD